MIGLGLIGGSIGLALRDAGWRVTGDDIDPERVEEALTKGCVDASGLDPGAAVTFVAVPVLAVADQAKRALAETSGVVSDVGGVKGVIAAAVTDARFVGGHPMAGSELDGLDGADGAMFSGAVWVLTPTPNTADTTFSTVAGVVAQLGAEVVAMAPERHDDMVAVVSHVPHLTAASLMGVAADRAEEHAALLRLAAGGFRDMTRVASGHPDIWLDICAENRPAILSALEALIGRLDEMREIVRTDARTELHGRLQRARDARTNLPIHATHPEELAEVRIPIPDRTGAAAEVFTLGRRAGRQHRQLRGGPPRREQRRRGRGPRRRRPRRSLPRRPDGPRLPPRRHPPQLSRCPNPSRTWRPPRERAAHGVRAVGCDRHGARVEEHRQPGARLRRAG